MAWETIYRDTWKRVEADRQIGLERTIYTGTSPDSSAAAALASTESSNAALAPIEWASISGAIPPGRRVIWGGKTWRNASGRSLTTANTPASFPELWGISRTRYNVASYGAAGDGVTDDAAAIQAAIDAAAAGGGGDVHLDPDKVYLIDQTQTITTDYLGATSNGLLLKTGVHLHLNGSTIQAKPTELDRSTLVMAYLVSDVGIYGGTLRGDRRTRPDPLAATSDRHRCFRSFRSKSVTLRGVRAHESRGAGFTFGRISIYFKDCATTAGSATFTMPSTSGTNPYRVSCLEVGDVIDSERQDAFPAGSTVVSIDVPRRAVTMSSAATLTTTLDLEFAGPSSDQITMTKCIADDNRFNGLVLESGRGYWIEDCAFANTVGTSPEAGVDIEPYYGYAHLQDVSMIDCRTWGNAMGGMYIQNLRNARVVGGSYPDGLMARAATGVQIAGVTAGWLTTKTAGVDVVGSRITGPVSVLNDSTASIYRDPMDVKLTDCDIEMTTPTTSSLVTLFNPASTPPSQRSVGIYKSRLVMDGASPLQRSLVGADANPAGVNDFTIADCLIVMNCPQDRSSIIKLPNTASGSLVTRNTILVGSPTLRPGTTVIDCGSSGATVSQNTVTVSPATAANLTSGTVSKAGNATSGVTST